MKNESKYIKYIEFFIMIILFFGIIIISKQLGLAENLKPNTSAEKTFMLIGIFILGFIVLAMHELGHLITGLINGFKFEVFVIGPFGVKREEDKVKLFLNSA